MPVNQDFKEIYKPETPVKSRYLLGTALAAVALALGVSNTYKLGEGETGEYMKDGKTYATTTEKGFHFTRPLSGRAFVKWSAEDTYASYAGKSLDGKDYHMFAVATYKVPDTYGMEDYIAFKHQFDVGLGAAFNDTVGKLPSKDINGPQASVVAQRLCDQFAASLPNTREGKSVKKPEAISCILSGKSDKAVVYSKK